MSRGREAWQQLAASYYAFDGFPELMFVFFFVGPFSEARLTGSFREALFGSAFFLGSGPFSALSAHWGCLTSAPHPPARATPRAR